LPIPHNYAIALPRRQQTPANDSQRMSTTNSKAIEAIEQIANALSPNNLPIEVEMENIHSALAVRRVADECFDLARTALAALRSAPQPTGEQPMPDISKHYTAVLVNAIRMSREEMTQLVKDLCDRGAHPPQSDVARLVEAGAELRFMCSHMLALTIQRQPGGAGQERQLNNAIREWDNAKATIPAVTPKDEQP
jgi:hypothetical protein